MSTDEAVSALAGFLAVRPVLRERLLAQHVDDGTGHCGTCALGAQRGHQGWPCTIAAGARAAARLAALRVLDNPAHLGPCDAAPTRHEPVTRRRNCPDLDKRPV